MGHDSWVNSMKQDDKYWLMLWTVVLAAIVLICLIISLYWQDHNALIAQMVLEGADPVAIMCAMQNDYGNHPSCIVVAMQQ